MRRYTLIIAALCVYAAVSRVGIINPISGGWICISADAVNRLEVFGRNPNYVAIYFYISMFLLLYQFFRYKKLPVRIIIAAAFLLNYLAVTLTFTRNVMLGFSLSMGAVAVMLAYEHFSLKKKSHKAAVLIVLMCVCAPLTYKSFDLSAQLLGRASNASVYENAAAEETVVVENPEQSRDFSDERGFADTGRLPIWGTAIPVLKENPSRLFIGSIDGMNATNNYFYEQYHEYGRQEYKDLSEVGAVHYHNSFLHVLMLTGLPGLLLVLAFMALLAVHMLRVFFSEKGKVPLEVKTLVIMLAGIFAYNLLESALFYEQGLSPAVFFLASGFIISYSKELKNI